MAPARDDGRRFRDRADAGRELAGLLAGYRGRPEVVVLGLPRGGVPVAAEVAAGLRSPLDVLVVRKLGVPGHEELAMGAIAEGGVRVLYDRVVTSLGIPPDDIERVAAAEGVELERRARAYRGERALVDVSGRVVIVVDDGLATGSTMRAAVAALRALGPARVVVAVPVGASATCDELGRDADEVICARMPARFGAVGQWYEDFSPPSDAELRRLLGGGPGRSVRPLGLLDALQVCVTWTAKVLAGVREDQLGLATPCPEWDVRTLAGHLVGVNRVLASAAEGLPREPDLEVAGPSAAALVVAYEESATAAVRAFSRADVLDTTSLALALLDNLVHGWDVAKATGQDTAIDPQLAGAGLEVARRLVTAELRAAGAFGPAVAVDADAPVHDRLVAFTGRQP
ncbi:MAG TPA: TIGR03086 family metal-binding protein [Acidimicrobiales bacterium]|nr:TIGR03086 family metal-binding protein [Acidimicrobiales bacterium]